MCGGSLSLSHLGSLEFEELSLVEPRSCPLHPICPLVGIFKAEIESTPYSICWLNRVDSEDPDISFSTSMSPLSINTALTFFTHVSESVHMPQLTLISRPSQI